MGAPPDTSASAYRHRSHTEDRETEQEKGQKQGTKWGEKRLEIKKKRIQIRIIQLQTKKSY